MKTRAPLHQILVPVVSLMTLIACNANKGNVAPAAAPAAREVYVIFEGPWAFVADPKDAGKVLALAPKTKAHRDLYVAASNNRKLYPGVYDFSAPGGTVGAGTLDPDIFQTQTTPSNIQRILDTKLERYAIRLPKPDAYVPSSRYPSSVGTSYPPDLAAQKDYVTGVSLRYSVTSLSGMKLVGNRDSGSFPPVDFRIETPIVRFNIDPVEEDDDCRMHSRESFRDLTHLLKLTLYVDFPDSLPSPDRCHEKDPQRPTTAAGPSPTPDQFLSKVNGLLTGAQSADLTSMLLASYQGVWSGQGLPYAVQHLATIYFFGGSPVACRSPNIFLSLGP